MNTVTRLSAYGAALALAFGGTYAIAGAVVPDSTVRNWTQHADNTHGGHTSSPKENALVNGTSSSAGRFLLSPIHAPTTAGTAGTLSFQIHDPDGSPVTKYDTEHGKELHLIVVRSDSSNYRHGHPHFDAATGTWSMPWTWDAAGTYRVYADFAADGREATLTRTINVGGTFEPITPASTRTDSVAGFEVKLSGTVYAGRDSDLTVNVTRGDKPVTTLQPYLGAFGHLVALRDGDLAYLHVHAHGEEPKSGQLAGPDVMFTANAPTAGRYFLYLDFQVDGVVHTAKFVVDAGDSPSDKDAPASDHSGH